MESGALLGRHNGSLYSTFPQIVDDSGRVAIERFVESNTNGVYSDQVLVVLLTPSGMSLVEKQQNRDGIDLNLIELAATDSTWGCELVVCYSGGNRSFRSLSRRC
jgi:hypothetical protein